MRLSHLAAVATLVALLGAMFIAMGSASAMEDLGDCDPDMTNVLGVTDSCQIPFSEATEQNPPPESGTDTSAVTLSGTAVTGHAVGSETVTVTGDHDGLAATDDTAVVYRFDVRKIEVTKIEFGVLAAGSFTTDNDNVFAAGTDVDVRVTVSYPTTDIPTVTVSLPTTGLSLKDDVKTSQRVTSADTHATRTANTVTVIVQGAHTILTDGAPEGLYTVTATATSGTSDDAMTSAKKTAELTVGDAGNVVADATLELGLMEGPSDGNATNDQPETGSVGRTGSVNLVLSVTNGIDNPARAADVDEIRVVAPFGDVMYYDGSSSKPVAADPKAMASALMKGSLVINVASSGGKARTIDAYAIVLGKVGVATTGTVSLNFTGDAASVDLEDATENLRSINLKDEMDSITLMVTAADSSGNTAAVPDPLTITVHDSDGKQLPTGNDQKLNAERMMEPGKTYIKVTNRSGNDASTALKAGDYMVKVKSGTIESSAMFTVVGTAASIDVEVGETNDNGEFEVTVTAMDAAGELVADGTPVMVEAPDLRGDADKVLFLARSDGKTKAGVAKATLVEIGPGNAAIIATVDGVTKVERYTSTYGAVEEEAMPEEEASVSCLSELSGFATWSCGVSADASEIFEMVSARGVSAIHLWNGSTWVRYSVVDDAMVPGSSDFMVTENDILYISN